MRVIAWTDGASVGVSDTECALSTSSSGGTATAKTTAIPNHARMMSTENLWIVRAMNGRSVCSWTTGLLLMRPSAGRT
jgi:hypothetical protein